MSEVAQSNCLDDDTDHWSRLYFPVEYIHWHVASLLEVVSPKRTPVLISSTLGSGCLQLENLIVQDWIDGSIRCVWGSSRSLSFCVQFHHATVGMGRRCSSCHFGWLVCLEMVIQQSTYFHVASWTRFYGWFACLPDSTRGLLIPRTRGFAMKETEEVEE